MTATQKAAYIATARRLIDIDPYNAQDYGETPASVADLVYSDPILIINELIDTIEELQQ